MNLSTFLGFDCSNAFISLSWTIEVYYNLYICLPAVRLNCLDRVLRFAARLIGRVSKFDQISAYMREVFHWLL